MTSLVEDMIGTSFRTNNRSGLYARDSLRRGRFANRPYADAGSCGMPDGSNWGAKRRLVAGEEGGQSPLLA